MGECKLIIIRLFLLPVQCETDAFQGRPAVHDDHLEELRVCHAGVVHQPEVDQVALGEIGDQKGEYGEKEHTPTAPAPRQEKVRNHMEEQAESGKESILHGYETESDYCVAPGQ